MLFKSFLTAVFLCILCFKCFAQTDEPNSDSPDYNSIERLMPDFTVLSSLYLPEETDAWTITISRYGGFAGDDPRFVGLVNSRGHFVCGDKVQTLEADSLQQISALMQGVNFKKLRKSFKHSPVFCSDCPITSLTIKQRRKNRKISTYDFSWFTLSDSNARLLQIFEKTSALAVCN